MKTLAFRFLAFAAVAMFLTLGASAQTPAAVATKPGAIKAAKVEGEVTKVAADGTAAKISNGDSVIETDTVITGKNGAVVLVFMNGSSLKLGADSKLVIEEFKMDPLAEDIQVAKLDREPSVSKTKLNLTYGELVGNVKHLNKESGSYYNVQTPVGAAGIRGTTFRIVFRPTGDGKAFTFTLSTAEGLVLFEGTTQGSGAPVDVPQDQEVVVTAQVDPATNTITSVDVSAPKALSQEAAAQITATATEAVKEAQSTTFTQTEQQKASETKTEEKKTEEPKKEETKQEEPKKEEPKKEEPKKEEPKKEEPKKEEPKKEEPKNTTPPPQATPTPPALTPGAG